MYVLVFALAAICKGRRAGPDQLCWVTSLEAVTGLLDFQFSRPWKSIEQIYLQGYCILEARGILAWGV